MLIVIMLCHDLFIVMLNVIMLSVVMLSVVMLTSYGELFVLFTSIKLALFARYREQYRD